MRYRVAGLLAAGMLACSGTFAPAQTSPGTLPGATAGPLATDTRIEEAREYLEAGNWAQAESRLRDVLATEQSSEAYRMLGYALFREKKAKESLAAYTDAARLSTPGPSDLKVVAFDYVLLGAYADADKWLTRVVQSTPNDGDAWYYLGRTKYNENRFAEAIAAFQSALRLQAMSVRAEDNLGLSYEGLNRTSDAETAFRTAIAWESGATQKSEQPYLNLGMLLMQEGRTKEALPQLERAAQLAPSNPKTQEQLGRAYQQAGQPNHAQAALERAVALAPSVAGLHFQLGMVYRQEGLREQAKREFDLCAQLNGAHSSQETPNPANR
jgi:tetratricopeptide (TPR) repeat protein